MLIPRKLKLDFYLSSFAVEFAVDPTSYVIKKDAPPSQLNTIYSYLHYIYTCMAVASLDLGKPVEEARDWLGHSFNAHLHQVRADPEGELPSNNPMFAFFVCGIFRDDDAARAYAEAWSKTKDFRGGVANAGDKQDWPLSTLLVTRALGKDVGPALEAVQALDTMKAGKKWAPLYENMKQLALASFTADPPEITPLLKKLGPQAAKAWSNISYEAQLCQRPLAFACVARDRGWQVPKDDPYPTTMRMALLTLPPKKIPLGDEWPQPSEDFKREVLAAKDAAFK